jgi:hypothetical protein
MSSFNIFGEYFVFNICLFVANLSIYLLSKIVNKISNLMLINQYHINFSKYLSLVVFRKFNFNSRFQLDIKYL